MLLHEFLLRRVSSTINLAASAAIYVFSAFLDIFSAVLTIFSAVLAVVAIFILTACDADFYVSDEDIQIRDSQLRIMEREDHDLCLSRGLDINEWNDVVTELYWQCRVDAAKGRMIEDSVQGEDLMYNAKMKKVVRQLLKKLQKARKANLAKINSDLEIYDHQSCIIKGFDPNSFDKEEVESYYACRRDIIKLRNIEAPNFIEIYGENLSLGKSGSAQPHKGGRARTLDKITAQAVDTNLTLEKYKICNRYRVSSVEFQDCSKAWDESVACLSELPVKIDKHMLNIQLYCQRQSALQFPNKWDVDESDDSSDFSDSEDENEEESDDSAEDGEDSDESDNDGESSNKEKSLDEPNGADDDSDKNNEGDNEGGNDRDDNSNSEAESADKESEAQQSAYSQLETIKLRERFQKECVKIQTDKIPAFKEKFIKYCKFKVRQWEAGSDKTMEFDVRGDE